jgi:DNA-binding transcriptional ArsR family regulator
MDDVVEPPAADFQLPRILAALADPHRLATVRYVARNGESWCTQVMQEAGLSMTKSTFSHHLRILREAGVLTKRIQGTRGYTRLRKDDLDRRFPGLIDAVLNVDTGSPGGGALVAVGQGAQAREEFRRAGDVEVEVEQAEVDGDRFHAVRPGRQDA